MVIVSWADSLSQKALDSIGRLKQIYAIERVLHPLLPLHLLKSLWDRFLERRPPGAVLTFACDYLVLRREPCLLT
jgi:hypothetical protein